MKKLRWIAVVSVLSMVTLLAVQSYITAGNSTADLSTYTHSAVNTGTAAADRYNIVGVACRKATAATTTITSASINGQSATIHVQRGRNGAATNLVALFSALNASGTTGDIVYTLDQTMSRCGYCIWQATSLPSITPTDTDSVATADPSVALTVPSNGFAIGIAATGGNSTTTWSGLTELLDTTVESATMAYTCGGADFVTGSTPTLTATFSGADNEDVGAFASWSFSAATGPPKGSLQLLGVGR